MRSAVSHYELIGKGKELAKDLGDRGNRGSELVLT